MTEYGAVAELADRMLEKYRRGEEPGLEDRLAWDGLTDEERDQFMALMEQRAAHGEECLEAIEAQSRALKALLRLQVRRAPSMSIREAIGSGHFGLLEVAEAIGAVPDPLAGHKPD
jgi:predicted Fe-S protein YdhL (DUF1289 family)